MNNSIRTFRQFIQESERSPGKHVIFLGGPPGGGKNTIAKPLRGMGFRVIDSDDAFEHLMRKHGLNMKMPQEEEAQRNVLRDRAKKVTQRKMREAINRGDPVVVNGTSRDPEEIHNTKRYLESLGYATHMVMVHVDNETSRQRNISRGQRGGRTVPEHIRNKIWNDVNDSRGHYKKMFGENYHELDNSIDHKTATDQQHQELNNNINSLVNHFEKTTLKENQEVTTTKKYKHYDPEEWHEATLKDEYYDIMGTF